MFVYNIHRRSLPCLILPLLFNSLWIKFKLLTKAFWDLVLALVKPSLCTCSHCCLTAVTLAPSAGSSEALHIVLASGPLNVPGGSVLFPSPKTYPCPVLCMFRSISSSRFSSTFPPTSSYFPVSAPFVSTRGCITRCNYMLFASLEAFSLH